VWFPVPQQTADGSFTLFSDEFGEAFHSVQGAKTEAFTKFVQATRLAHQAQQARIKVLDICYGLGYNTAAALETIWQTNPTCSVELYGLEVDGTIPQAAIAAPFIDHWPPTVQVSLKYLAYDHHIQDEHLSAQILIGDARQTIQQLVQSKFQADAIFFDPFSPRRCPQLWTVEFFQKVVQCLAPNGTLATYSRSAAVRSAMQHAGLSIGTIPLIDPSHSSKEWSQGTIGQLKVKPLSPLSPMEQEHLLTRAAIPYRDPNLTDTTAEILARHLQEQQRSTLESTSSWRRRWGIH
jgi:tRNA U34 5-methylaminomethyl-2-thiouridine-forming methyltransferase MnmC